MSKLAIYQGVVTDANGNIVPLADVEVRGHTSGNPLISLFSDRNGNTTKVNPFQANSDGTFQFFAAAGAFKVTVDLGTDTRELDYVAVGTAAEYDANDLLFAVLIHTIMGGKFTSSLPSMPFDVILPCTLYATDKLSFIAKVRTAPNADRVISVVKNSVQFATISILNGALTGTFTMAADVDLVAGDQIWVIMPASADTVMADFSMALVARR